VILKTEKEMIFETFGLDQKAILANEISNDA